MLTRLGRSILATHKLCQIIQYTVRASDRMSFLPPESDFWYTVIAVLCIVSYHLAYLPGSQHYPQQRRHTDHGLYLVVCTTITSIFISERCLLSEFIYVSKSATTRANYKPSTRKTLIVLLRVALHTENPTASCCGIFPVERNIYNFLFPIWLLERKTITVSCTNITTHLSKPDDFLSPRRTFLVHRKTPKII